MGRSRRAVALGAVAVAILAVVVTTGARASAEPPPPAGPPPFRLRYDAKTEDCPNAPAFLGAIHARTERARLAAPEENATAVAVTIDRDEAGAVLGRVEIRALDGDRQERVVTSPTCSDVSKALALIVALYLDPDATSDPARSDVSPPEPAHARRPSPPPPPAPANASRPATALTFGPGASVGLQGAVGPSMAPTGSLFGEVSFPYGSAAWSRAVLRVSVDASTTTANVGPGDQRYLLLAGTLQVCPVTLPLLTHLHAAPCAGFQAGLHRGTSQGVPNERTQDNPWAAPSATADLIWEVGRRVSLRIGGGIIVPLVRTRFFLAPDLTLFETPAVAGTAALSVVVRFP